MAMPLYPKIQGKMAEHGHGIAFVANVLGMSCDTLRRCLRGVRQFELSEIYGLMQLYSCSFEELFPFKDSA